MNGPVSGFCKVLVFPVAKTARPARLAPANPLPHMDNVLGLRVSPLVMKMLMRHGDYELDMHDLRIRRKKTLLLT